MAYSKRHRVVIEVDQDMRDGKVEEFSNVLTLRMSRGFTAPIDPRAFNVFDSGSKSFTDRPMHFDCVGTARNIFNRAETAMLMDQLLLQKSNCCVLHFFAERSYQLHLLCTLLINEVDKRMTMMQTKMQKIQVEYYDVRKYDVVNLLDFIPDERRKRNKFCCTLDLLKWLQEDYIRLFNYGSGHENLDVTFIFTDPYYRMYKVKLSIMMLYLNKMDGDTRSCLCSYFENVHNKKKKMKNLMLTDCLREIFSYPTHWYAWFVFHLPLANGSGVVIDDLLKLANAAYSGLKQPPAVDKIDRRRVQLLV